jgi:hypothetical protein
MPGWCARLGVPGARSSTWGAGPGRYLRRCAGPWRSGTGGCRFPGCGIRFTEAHHIVHWADGGETKLSNLVLLCRFHHRAVHEEGFSVKLVWGRFGKGGRSGQGERSGQDGRSGRVDRIRFFDRAGWPLPDAAPPMSAMRRAGGGGPPGQGEPDPLRALIRTHSRRGVRPDGFTPSARWRTSREIPWVLEARALEALDS